MSSPPPLKSIYRQYTREAEELPHDAGGSSSVELPPAPGPLRSVWRPYTRSVDRDKPDVGGSSSSPPPVQSVQRPTYTRAGPPPLWRLDNLLTEFGSDIFDPKSDVFFIQHTAFYPGGGRGEEHHLNVSIRCSTREEFERKKDTVHALVAHPQWKRHDPKSNATTHKLRVYPWVKPFEQHFLKHARKPGIVHSIPILSSIISDKTPSATEDEYFEQSVDYDYPPEKRCKTEERVWSWTEQGNEEDNQKWRMEGVFVNGRRDAEGRVVEGRRRDGADGTQREGLHFF